MIPGTTFPFNLLPVDHGRLMLGRRASRRVASMDPAGEMMKYMPLMFMFFLYKLTPRP